jgi:hypothetical protein
MIYSAKTQLVAAQMWGGPSEKPLLNLPTFNIMLTSAVIIRLQPRRPFTP